MTNWTNAAFTVLRRLTGGPAYNYEQTRDIQNAGTQAAFDIIEEALHRKIDALGLHCPVTRYDNSITLRAGRLNREPIVDHSDDDARITLHSLEGGASMLKSKLNTPLYQTDEPRLDIARFNVHCPKGSRRFMEFFKAIGMLELHECYDLKKADISILCGNTKWVSTQGFYFDAESVGNHGERGGQIYCPTAGLLRALDINPKTFAAAVTNARLKKAKTFGPIRETHKEALTCAGLTP